MREVILDTETTGLNYSSGDRIIEVGCVELFNYVPTGKNLQFYCSTEKKIGQDAIEVHGLTNEFLNKHPTFEEQYKKLLDFIKNDTLIIHNAEFDVGFVNNELSIIGVEPIKNEVIDTVKMARQTLNTRMANLDFLCRKFSVDLSARKLHGALLDCNLLAEVYIELKGGKQAKMDLSAETKQEMKEIDKNKKRDHVSNKVLATNQEISSHKKFIKSIKNSIWSKLDY